MSNLQTFRKVGEEDDDEEEDDEEEGVEDPKSPLCSHRSLSFRRKLRRGSSVAASVGKKEQTEKNDKDTTEEVSWSIPCSCF